MDTQYIARHIFRTMVDALEASEENTVEQVCEAVSRAQAMMYAMIGTPAHTSDQAAPVVVEQEKPKRKRRSKAEIEADKAVEHYDASSREHKKIFADAFTQVGYSLDTQSELAKELSKAAEKAKRLPTTSDLADFLTSETKGE